MSGLSDLPELLNTGLSLFVGVGNVLRSDDGIGVYIAQRIRQDDHIRVINVEVSIENYIGKINSVHPDRIIIIDCVHFGQDPGYYELLPVSELQDQTTHTHNISLQKVSELFRAPVWMLGVQPGSVAFGDIISPPLLKTAEEIIGFINNPESPGQTSA